MIPSRPVLILLCVLSVAGCTGGAAQLPESTGSTVAAVENGCTPPTIPPDWAGEVTQGTRLGPPEYPPIRSDLPTTALDSAPDIAGKRPVGLAPSEGRPATYAVALHDVDPQGNGRDIVIQYASTISIDPDLTLDGLLRAGGVMFTQQTGLGGDGAYVIKTVGDRALSVLVGPYTAALVHADPIDDAGTRTYNLYWSDGKVDFSLIGGIEADEVISIAQGLYCN